MKHLISIVAADKNPIVTMGIQALLRHSRFYKLHPVHSGEELMETLEGNLHDALIFGLNLFGADSGRFLKKIKSKNKALKIIVFLSHNIPFFTNYLLKMGIHGFVSKNSSEDELLTALQVVLNGKTYIGENVRLDSNGYLNNHHLFFDENIPEALGITERELSIITLFGNGYAVKEVANELFISTHTVESHKKNIMRKINGHSFADIIKFAVKCGLA